MEANTTTLIVENVSAAGEMTGSYQFQSATPDRIRTQITENTIRFGGRVRFTFTLLPDGRMSGERVMPQLTNTTMLTRR